MTALPRRQQNKIERERRILAAALKVFSETGYSGANMLAFSAGYVAMSRHVRNAGAFYAYAARGLGGLWGGASAFVALAAYNALQFGLIGLLGGVAAGVFTGLGITLPWWGWSLGAVLMVGMMSGPVPGG